LSFGAQSSLQEMSRFAFFILLPFGMSLRQSPWMRNLVFTTGENVCTHGATANEVAAAANANLTGKVVIVTGGSGGIGQAIVESFARQKAIVIMANRNVANAIDAADVIAQKTGGDIRVMHLDLGSFESVRSFAKMFLHKFNGELHYLINNAGILGESGSRVSQDGFELTLQVNYLGHFLLTELLLPALRQNRPSRVINVASTAHVTACQAAGWSIAIPPTARCLKKWQKRIPQRTALNGTQWWFPRYFKSQPTTLYGVSKFLQIQHAAELAHREGGTGPEVLSVGPGVVMSDMGKEAMILCKEQWINPPGVFHQRPCPYEPQVGAAIVAYAALHSERNGKWLVRYRDCGEKKPFMSGFPKKDRGLLYELSRQWVGLSH
jgi:NAD(P)-dependent dehydrogenase (short-subunit alcohol dehydrogenase family)